MINFLKTTQRALPLALALAFIGTGVNAQSVSVAVYVNDTRLLTIPAVNVPGEGSYQAQLVLEGDDPGLRVGRVLKLSQLLSADKAFKLPVAYLANEIFIAVPALAVKTPDGRVSYFDITLRNISNGGPLTFMVASMVDTTGGQGGQSSTKGETGPQGPAGYPGATGSAGPAGAQGSPGAPGAMGAPGPQGVPGATGPAGATGAAGMTGTAGVDGKTVLNGAVDPAADVGKDGDFYFNTATTTIFGPKAAGAWPAGVLIKGAAGAAGADGAAGPAGAPGAMGLPGTPGATGPQGTAGSTGPAGATGSAGATGPVGATGPAGTPGTDGKTVLNGAVDPAADVGKDGDFYFNTATTTIFGPKAAGAWPAGTSLKGAAGAAGPAGSPGPTGAAGSVGPAGPAGAAGSTGLTGPTGPAGLTGPAGATGLTGPAGPAGSGGSGTGATGSSAHVVALTTVLGGLVGTVGVLPLYGYNQVALPVVGLGGIAALSVLDEPYSMAQPFKSGATLTKIQAVIGLKAGLTLIGSTATVTATLYKIPLSGSPVSTGLSCDLGPPLTGILAIGAKASCTGTGSVSVNAGDRGLIVFSATANGLSLVNVLALSAAASVE